MKSESVKAWIDGIKPEHSILAQRVDKLIKELIPEIQFTMKWHKPSQPLGVPFYGLPDKGWMIDMWSFKNEFAVGFIAGTLLDPEPPVTKMAGPWNRNPDFKARKSILKTKLNLTRYNSAPGLNKLLNFRDGERLRNKIAL